MRSTSLRRFAILALTCSAACGAGEAVATGPGTTTGMQVRPPVAGVPVNGSAVFAAQLAGAPTTAVQWTIEEPVGGTIGAAGDYQAPASPGIFHVVATSVASPAVQGKATVQVISVGTPPPPTPRLSVTTLSASGSPVEVPVSLAGWAVLYWTDLTAFFEPDQTWGAIPRDYVIQGWNGSTWVALPGCLPGCTVTGNVVASRMHLADLSGYSRVRIAVSASNGTGTFRFSVHDARLGTEDTWLLLGDSITSAAWKTENTTAFGDVIHSVLPQRYPAGINGGRGGWGLASPLDTTEYGGETRIHRWLTDFPGRYVALSYGSNDAVNVGHVWSAAELNGVEANLVRLVAAVVEAGKIPVIPTVVWGNSNAWHSINAASLNQRIGGVIAAHPPAMAGPDLYGLFQGQTAWLADGLHPNATGYAQLRQAWADWAVRVVYGGN